jgi:hypothetical protein
MFVAKIRIEFPGWRGGHMSGRVEGTVESCQRITFA